MRRQVTLPPLDEQPLMNETRRVRTQSHRLDTNEDPVTGLERISSYSILQSAERRRDRERRLRLEGLADQELRRRHRSAAKDEHILSEKYESLDYEIVENELYKVEETDPDHHKKLFRQSTNRWVVCFLIGICTAIVAVFIDIMVYYSAQIKFHFILQNLVNLCDHKKLAGGGCMWMVLSAWTIYNCTLVGIASALVLLVSPAAAGSGIPQVKCFLNGVQIPGVVRLKTLMAKAIGVACSVGGGLSAGKEGPMIHSGAVVAAGISQGRCISLPFDLKIWEYFRNDREKRDFVSAGAAAGVAAAFSSPIGGVLFSLEEGASFWNQNLTWRMVFTAMISSFTVNVILSVFYGQSGFLSWSGLANFGVFKDNSYNLWEIPVFALIGVMGGVLGGVFNILNTRLAKFRKNYIKKKYQKFFEALLVAAASAFTGFLTLFIVDDCQPMGANPFVTEMTKLWCPKGHYISAVANLFFANPEESVKQLFHSPMNSFRPITLFIFAIEYYLLTLWTFGLSVPAGVFIPSLLTGAAWGRLVGIFIERMFPEVTGIDPGKYALAGAAAQLGGIVRMTISLTAILVEATREITFSLPIMLVLMMAKWVGDQISEGLYDSYIDLDEIPFLGWHPPKLSRNVLAQHVMRKDVVALEPRERVSRIVEILRTTKHHAFPVVDRIDPPLNETGLPDYGRIKGIVLRSQLITLLKKKHFYMEYECKNPNPLAQPVTLSDFRNCYPRYDVPISALGLSIDDERCWLSLEIFRHPTPHRVTFNASLDQIFRLFRGLGLRHLCVVNDDNRLRGIITRKDIARYKERRMKNKYILRELYINTLGRIRNPTTPT